MVLDAKRFARSSDGSLVAEISMLRLERAPRCFTLVNFPGDGQHRSFRCDGVDECGGGDVAGWRYVEENGPNFGRSWADGHPAKAVSVARVLIIND